ncbi:MAG TPA: CheR family methyltransferase [Thermoleophilaceae bacterium]|nr:CheR family methyltransferase [Thermoleophilaceae bacterium]
MPASVKHRGATVSLARASGLELGAYREDHVEERVRRALEREGVEDVEELARRIAADAGARERFRQSVAMVVTGLFRDPDQFELLEHEILPSVRGARRQLRVWSAGCADGSELYSAGIVLAQANALEGATLLGSDLLEENVRLAELGVYGDVRMPAALRSRMRWERRDLLTSAPPPGRWSVILCRNVAIYFTREAKLRLHRRLASVLAPAGVLLLGRSERISDPGALGLAPCAAHAYRRVA